MSSKNKVLKLNKKIDKCQGEVQELLQEKEKQGWSENSEVMEQRKQTIKDNLRRQKLVNSIQTSNFEKEIEDLEKSLKCVEEWESGLKEILNRRQVCFAEYKIGKESNLQNMEQGLKELEKIMSDESGVNELQKRSEEMEKRLKNLDSFCAAIYSTLGSKESKKHI